IERGSQIVELVNAVMESVTAIANGALGGAAKLIENALSKALPVVISFMASLLGLGGISKKIQEIIQTVKEPIDNAIEWLISQAVKFAKKIGKKLGFGKEKNKDSKEDIKETEKSTEVKANVRKELGSRMPVKVESAEEVQSVISSVYQTYKPEGLKYLDVVQVPNKLGQFEVKASASPEETVTKFGLKAASLSLDDIDPRSPNFEKRSVTWIIAKFNGETLGRIENEIGGDHAEKVLIDFLENNWDKLPHEEGKQDQLDLDMNNSPCGESTSKNCSLMLSNFCQKRKIELNIRAMNFYSGTRSEHTGGTYTRKGKGGNKGAQKPPGSFEGLKLLLSSENTSITVLTINDLTEYGIDLNAMVESGEITAEDRNKIEDRINRRGRKLTDKITEIDKLNEGSS
ncbi:hypothetical protein GF357_01900, partial [Candidatus Dojkabacteria bacterium]|nr:hypothetical protein [Candidatus Dojkabacteria bacterium]